MKIEIINDCPPVEQEDTLRLKLVPNSGTNKGVKLVAVNKDGGELANLVGISARGCLHRYRHLKGTKVAHLLKLDSAGAVATTV